MRWGLGLARGGECFGWEDGAVLGRPSGEVMCVRLPVMDPKWRCAAENQRIQGVILLPPFSGGHEEVSRTTKGLALRDHSGVRVDEAAFCTQRMRSGMRVIVYSDERVMFKVTRLSGSWSFEKISRRSRRRAVEVAQVQVGRGGTLIFPWQGRQTSTSFSPFLRYH